MDKNKPKNQGDPITKLDVLYALYNEKLDFLVRNECDLDYYTYLCIAFPNDKEAVQQKVEVQNRLPKIRKMVEIIRKHIQEEKNPKVLGGES